MLASRIRPSRCWLASLLFASALSIAAPFAYVTSDRAVSVIDTASNTMDATVPQAGGGRVAVNPAGTLTYVVSGSGSQSNIDTRNKEVIGKVPIENLAFPYGIAIHTGYARKCFVLPMGRRRQHCVRHKPDHEDGSATVPLGFRPVGIAVNRAGTRLYVAGYVGNAIVVIDAVTNSVLARIASLRAQITS